MVCFSLQFCVLLLLLYAVTFQKANIGQLFNLRTLFIGGSLSGVISEKHFSKLFNLESLVLNSGFSFDIDPKWIPPFQLREIGLKNTSLGPTFPEWLYTQRRLGTIDFSHSRLSSINADKFWSFAAKIRAINLSYNAISADLSNVTINSKYIWLGHNNFTGTLPRISANVFFISLENNFLSGSISPFLCHKFSRKSALGYLDVSYNLLTGVIPDCWENVRGLTFLFIGNNKLEGEIPPSIGLLNETIVMDFNKNNLSGEFSLDLSNMKSLVCINLGNNCFSGVVPSKMPESMQVMILRSNQFSSNFPQQICNLPSLIQLDVSQNKLFGSIPPCVFNISSMDGERRIIHFGFNLDLFWKGRELGRVQGGANKSEIESLYLGMGVGFAVGLWGVWASLFLNTAWRHKYVLLLDHVADWLYVFIVLKINKFVR
ncbi:hypothetical protein ACSQ67_011351 [Phaseolus vulgaris]